MALRNPPLVKVASATSGSGTYTYTEAAQAGYRTFTDAVADGDFANGDTCYLMVMDTGALGSARLFEWGLYTVNTVALTITRTGVIQSSDGVAISASWGAGVRDIFVVTIAQVLAFLGVANVFTATQTIRGAELRVDLAAGDEYLRLSRNIGGAAGSLAGFSAKTAKEPLFLDCLWSGAGSAAGETYTQFRVGDSVAPTNGPKIRETGELQTGGGVPYEAFPSGTELLFGTAPPTGWTRVNETEDFLPRLAKSADTVGATGGSWTLSGLTSSGGVTGNHTLTESEIPSHAHGFSDPVVTTQVVGIAGILIPSSSSRNNSASTTGAAGGGGAHAHTLPAIASDGTWRPRFRVLARATKN